MRRLTMLVRHRKRWRGSGAPLIVRTHRRPSTNWLAGSGQSGRCESLACRRTALSGWLSRRWLLPTRTLARLMCLRFGSSLSELGTASRPIQGRGASKVKGQLLADEAKNAILTVAPLRSGRAGRSALLRRTHQWHEPPTARIVAAEHQRTPATSAGARREPC